MNRRLSFAILCGVVTVLVPAGVALVFFPVDPLVMILCAFVPLAGVYAILPDGYLAPEDKALPRAGSLRSTPVLSGTGTVYYDDDDDDDDEIDEADDQSLAGLWNGTVRLGPGADTADVSFFPLRVTFSTPPTRASVPPRSVPFLGDGIVSVDVLEHDSEHGHLDLRVVVARPGHLPHQTYVAQLVHQEGMLVPNDETEPFTVTLHRASACIEAGTLAGGIFT